MVNAALFAACVRDSLTGWHSQIGIGKACRDDAFATIARRWLHTQTFQVMLAASPPPPSMMERRNGPEPSTGLRAVRGLLALATDFALLASSYAAFVTAPNPLLKVCAILFASVQLHRLALLGHEGAHGLLLGRSKLNDALANVVCLYQFGVTVAGYRQWHFEHHRVVGTDRDPEYAFKRGPKYTSPKSIGAFARMFALDIAGAGTPELLRLCHCCRPRNTADALGLISYWSVVVTLLVWFGRPEVLLAHVAAIFTGFWALFRIRGWTEHVATTGSECTHRFRSPWVLRYCLFPHSTDMHWEHHRYPGIPAYRLHELRDRIAQPPVVSLSELFDTFAGKNMDDVTRRDSS